MKPPISPFGVCPELLSFGVCPELLELLLLSLYYERLGLVTGQRLDMMHFAGQKAIAPNEYMRLDDVWLFSSLVTLSLYISKIGHALYSFESYPLKRLLQ